jgi:hypothetical protein
VATTRIRIASVIALAYLAVVLGGTLVHFANTGDTYTLRVSLTQPATWLASIVAAVVAFGLWRRYRWAWWLGVGAAAFQLFRLGAWLAEHYSLSKLPGASAALVGLLLIVFLAMLLPSKVRASCNR